MSRQLLPLKVYPRQVLRGQILSWQLLPQKVYSRLVFSTSDFVASNLDAPQTAIGGPAALGGSPGPPGLPRPEPEPVRLQNPPARSPGLLCAADASSAKPDIVEYLRQNFPDVDINAWQAGGLRRMGEHYEQARLLEIVRWAAENGISAATLLKDLPQLLHRIEIRAGPVLTPA